MVVETHAVSVDLGRVQFCLGSPDLVRAWKGARIMRNQSVFAEGVTDAHLGTRNSSLLA